MKRVLLTVTLLGTLAGCAATRPDVPPGWTPAAPTAGQPAPTVPPTPAPDPSPEAPWARVEAVALPPPPWDYTLSDSLGRRAVEVPRLTRLLESPNQVTDDDAWLARNGFTRPGLPEAPVRPLPFLYRGEARLRVVENDGFTLGIYGAPSGARYLLVAGEGGSRRAFDFSTYRRAPRVQPGDEGFVEQDLVWAAVAAGRLYVAHAHRTYAASSGGQNGYVTALDLTNGRLLWRSRPRVANAATFAVVGDGVVTGYGFTAEPDALFVLDRYTGEVLQEAPVRTAPQWILPRGDRLFVRAYDADYVFGLR